MLLDNVDPLKWYTVRETAVILGWGVDAIRRQIYRGNLQALVMPGRIGRRVRRYRATRIQGCEIIRYAKANLTPLKPTNIYKAIEKLLK